MLRYFRAGLLRENNSPTALCLTSDVKGASGLEVLLMMRRFPGRSSSSQPLSIAVQG